MTQTLHQRLAEISTLNAAWLELVAKDAADGAISAGLAAFAENLKENLQEIATSLTDGTFEPDDLVEVRIPKDDGSKRVLQIPTARDRVVERALLDLITPWVDQILGAAAFGFRPGLGVVDAVQAVVRLREEGYNWVLRTDIKDCFPTLDPTQATGALRSLVPDAAVVALVVRFTQRCVRSPKGRAVAPGLPQGSPLSPLLCNLALLPLDGALTSKGHPTIRYADDLVIAARSKQAAEQALMIVRDTLERMTMTIAEEKTEVMSFDDGFCFLGEDFGNRYPPELADHRVTTPERRILYAARQGGRVRVKSGRVIVESEDAVELLSVPQSQVSRIVCFGAVGLSAGVRAWAMGTDVPVTFASRRGSYQGQLLAATGGPRVARLKAQLAMTEAAALGIARRIVEAKLVKQAVLLRHFLREDNARTVSPSIAQIEAMVAMLGQATTTMELMGLEGAAANAYFGAWRALLPEELAFSGRNRQPPLDVVNAALSLGYTILQGECATAVVATGLEPAIGCLHTESRNQPALVLDLMEEFRPLIVDQVVLQLARSHALRPEHGETPKGKTGVLLTRAGKEALLPAYERRMLTHARSLPDFSGTWRRHLYRQAQQLRAAIEGDELAFTGLSWR